MKPKKISGADSVGKNLTLSFQNLVNAIEDQTSRDVRKIKTFEFFSKTKKLEDEAHRMKEQALKAKHK